MESIQDCDLVLELLRKLDGEGGSEATKLAGKALGR